MKRYLLFIYSYYYPNGGWNDFQGSFSTTEEAKQVALKDLDYRTAHLIDTKDNYNMLDLDGNPIEKEYMWDNSIGQGEYNESI